MNIYRVDLALIHIRIELVYYVIIKIPILIFHLDFSSFVGIFIFILGFIYIICKSTICLKSG